MGVDGLGAADESCTERRGIDVDELGGLPRRHPAHRERPDPGGLLHLRRVHRERAHHDRDRQRQLGQHRPQLEQRFVRVELGHVGTRFVCVVCVNRACKLDVVCGWCDPDPVRPVRRHRLHGPDDVRIAVHLQGYLGTILLPGAFGDVFGLE